MGKIISISCLVLFFIFGICLSSFVFYKGYFFTGILTVVILGLSTIIFTSKKAYPFRFMYPGLITFLFFMVLPIIFTILIGFTNLSTGHLLSQKKVYSILQEETYISDAAEENSYIFKLIQNDDQTLTILTSTSESLAAFTANFKKDTPKKKIQLFLTRTTINALADDEDANILSRGKIFRLKKMLNNIKFVLPSGIELGYYRSDSLINVQKKYLSLPDKKLKDIASGEIYYPDLSTGFYTNGENNLTPGFFVTVGLKNYLSLFTNPSIKSSFMKILIWTLIWAFSTVILTFSLGMFLALVVNNKNFQLKSVYRALLIIPYSIPFFISILIFKGLLNKDFGIINELICNFGFAKVSWLENPLMAKISCLLVNLWLGFPYMFLITTGILQSIPESVYEAASLDGAGKFATFKNITLPMIFSAIAPLLVGAFAFNLNNFVGIYLLTGGGPPIPGAMTPAGETDILISYTYRLAFEGGQGQDFGLASSIALFIFIIISIITLINFKFSGMMKENQT